MTDPTAAELANAALVLVRTALKLEANERLVVILDQESDFAGAAIRRAAEAAGAHVTLGRLDQLRSVATNHSGERPHKVLPDAIRRALATAQASCFLASAPHQELTMREQLLHIIGAQGIRHCHMPGASPQAFARGFALGYDKVATWGQAVARRLELAKVVDAESPAGTKLRATLSPHSRWVARTGEILPGRAVAFPCGALYAAPDSVNGIFVANASLGEFFGERAGLLLRTPVRFSIEAGRVTRVAVPGAPDLERDLKGTLQIAPNSDRVGLLVIGVNVGIQTPTGEASVDQNLPGLHLVIGDPSGRDTGVNWTARTAFPACGVGSRVCVDGTAVIAEGKIVSVL
jgi:aminopeptidase